MRATARNWAGFLHKDRDNPGYFWDGWCPSTNTAVISPLRILLVEDDPDTNRAMSKLLVQRGYAVHAAADGKAALAAPDLEKFALVICDIGLPDISGWELLVELKQRAPQLQAIALTGLGAIGDYGKSAEAGFALHVTKPAHIDALNRAISQLFGNPRPPD